jgi:hypothetical protein
MTGLDDQAEKRRQAQEWLVAGNLEQRTAAVEYLSRHRPLCPEDCGCRLGPDLNGNHDADVRECGCDGPCTGEG